MFHVSKISKKRLEMIRRIIFIIVVFMLVACVGLLFVEEVAKKRNRLWFSIFQFIIMLLLMGVPQKLKERWNFRLPIILEVSFLLFAFGSFVLGEVFNFYDSIPLWDAFLHAISGIILAYLGLVLIKFFIQNKNVGIQLSPSFVLVAVVLFSLSVGALWEISEFLADEWFGMNSQQYMKTTGGSQISEKDVPLVGHEALRDTMEDLLLDLGGAMVVVVFEYGTVKRKFSGKK